MADMTIPPQYDENGTVLPNTRPDEAYTVMAGRLANAHAGGWALDSIPGKNAVSELQGFIRETQARAVEAFARWKGEADDPSVMQYASDIRAGRTDLDGNPI